MEQNERYGKELFSSASKYPQDLVYHFPPKQEGISFHNRDRFSAFAISLRGASHSKSGAPCQDFSDVREIDGNWMVAAIADGVGSCKLSHWGAYIAVNTACNYIVSQMKRPLAEQTEVFIHNMMDRAFSMALQGVEDAADRAEVTVGNLQSTLTVALYNTAGTLYFCHIGDSGIVAQKMDGTVSLITPRMKGEEASSVYPLQSRTWKHGKKTLVAAFVMATDGVLDRLALNLPKMTYFNQIYYPTMEPAVYNMQVSNIMDQSDRARSVMAQYRDLLESSDYQKRVSDDITFVTAISHQCLAHAKHPQFDSHRWEQEVQNVLEWQRQIDRPPRVESPLNREPDSPDLQIQPRGSQEEIPNHMRKEPLQDKGKRPIVIVLVALCVVLLSGSLGIVIGLRIATGSPKEDALRHATGQRAGETSSQTTEASLPESKTSGHRLPTQKGTSTESQTPKNTYEQIKNIVNEAEEQHKKVADCKKNIDDLLKQGPSDSELNSGAVQSAKKYECEALESAIEVNRLACQAIELMLGETINEAGPEGAGQVKSNNDEGYGAVNSNEDNPQSDLDKENKKYTELRSSERLQEKTPKELERLDDLVESTMKDIEDIRSVVSKLEQLGGDNASLSN